MIRSLQKELSGKQLPQASIDTMLWNKKLPKESTGTTYARYREIRKDATVSLVREIAPGPILAANWTIDTKENTPDEWLDLVSEDVKRVRDDYLLQAVRGLNDFGWMPFEKIWYKDENGYARLKVLKALIHDYTNILVDTKGNFVGFQQTDIAETVIPLSKCLLLSQDVEGTNWYGTGKLEIVAKVQSDWDDSNNGANRYDAKVAGSHWVVYYPIGKTTVEGTEKDNYDLAGDILNALESSGKMRLPAAIQSHLTDLNGDGKSEWKVEPISDTVARQHSFVARLEYLDRLKVRAYGFPEDTILKTRYTPKTEQGVHANIVATAQDVQHRYIVNMLNKHVVDQTLRYNFGKKAAGAVFVNPAPITSMSLEFLQYVYKMLLNNQAVVTKEYNGIDLIELRTKIAVPNNGIVEEVSEEVLKPTSKTVEDPLEEGSFKSEGLQN